MLRAGRFANVAFMVGLALAIAASCNLPVLVMSIFWKGLTTRGAMIGGFLGNAVVGVILLPAVWKRRSATQGVGAGPARQPGTILDHDRIRRHLAVRFWTAARGPRSIVAVSTRNMCAARPASVRLAPPRTETGSREEAIAHRVLRPLAGSRSGL